jgi:hypothetical protein
MLRAHNCSALGVAHEMACREEKDAPERIEEASGLRRVKVIPFFGTSAIILTSRILCAAYTYLSCNGLMLVR